MSLGNPQLIRRSLRSDQ